MQTAMNGSCSTIPPPVSCHTTVSLKLLSLVIRAPSLSCLPHMCSSILMPYDALQRPQENWTNGSSRATSFCAHLHSSGPLVVVTSCLRCLESSHGRTGH